MDQGRQEGAEQDSCRGKDSFRVSTATFRSFERRHFIPGVANCFGQHDFSYTCSL